MARIDCNAGHGHCRECKSLTIQGLLDRTMLNCILQWICREVADRLNLRIKATEPVRYITFDGRCFSSEETVEATWAVERQSKTHVNVFRVAPSEAPFDVLLGRELTFSNAVDFDSEVRSIRTCVEKPPTVCGSDPTGDSAILADASFRPRKRSRLKGIRLRRKPRGGSIMINLSA